MPTVRLVRKSRGPAFAELEKAMRAPLADGRGEGVARVMWKGDGSTDDQFQRRQTLEGTSSREWKPTEPFGSRPATRPTLQDTGAYRTAWTGGTGHTLDIVRGGARARVRIGVDPTRFPQARVFQKRGTTTQRVTRKQRFYLGKRYGVWLREGQTLTNHPRAVRVNDVMVNRAQRFLVRALATGRTNFGVPR